MTIVSCRITLHLPEARSLKDKRQVVQGLMKKLRDRHNLSAAEVESRDLWHTAVLGIAIAARDRREAESRVERVKRDVEDLTRLKYVDFETTYHT